MPETVNLKEAFICILISEASSHVTWSYFRPNGKAEQNG